jgi:negative regulator of flagellin synthesis FlgM
MMVDKIGGVNPLNNVQNAARSNETGIIKSDPDSINVSDEAKKMATAYYLNQVSKETPDVRSDLVQQIKEKIKDPNYLNDTLISSAADRIMTAYGL